MNKKAFISCTITLLLVSAAFAGDVAVIVNNNNPATEIAKGDLSKMFLGRKSEWPDGAKVQPCDQKAETAAAKSFCTTYLDKSTADYQAYWMEKMLSGAATPPKNVSNDQEVIDFVSKTNGGIGYIDAGTAPGDGVKVLPVK